MITIPQIFKDDIEAISNFGNIATILKIENNSNPIYISTQKGMFGKTFNLNLIDDFNVEYIEMFNEWWIEGLGEQQWLLSWESYEAQSLEFLNDPAHPIWTGGTWFGMPPNAPPIPFTYDEYERSRRMLPTLPDIYLEDRDLKISSIKESINLHTKKIKLSSVSIQMSNAVIGGEMFSDKIQRVLGDGVLGKKLKIYYKSQSAKSIDECLQVALMKITRYTHDENYVKITADDTSIETFYLDLPLAKYHYYNEDETFETYNGKPVPILYGHLENAPSLLYIKNKDTENYYTNNNLHILFDNSYFSGVKIGGAKRVKTVFNGNNARPTWMDQFRSLKIAIGDNIYDVPCVPFIQTRDWIRDMWKYPQYETFNDHIALTTDSGGYPTKVQEAILWLNDIAYAGLPDKAFKTIWTPSQQADQNYDILRGWALATVDVFHNDIQNPTYAADAMIGNRFMYQEFDQNNSCTPFTRIRRQRIYGDGVEEEEPYGPSWDQVSDGVWAEYDDIWITEMLGITFPFPAFEGSVNMATYPDAGGNDVNYQTDFAVGGRFRLNQEDVGAFDDFSFVRMAGSTEAPYLPDGLIDQPYAWDEPVGVPPNTIDHFVSGSYDVYRDMYNAMQRQSLKWLTGSQTSTQMYYWFSSNVLSETTEWNDWKMRNVNDDENFARMNCANFTIYTFANFQGVDSEVVEDEATEIDVRFSVLGLNAKRMWANKEIYSKKFFVNARGRLGKESQPLVEGSTFSKIMNFEGEIRISQSQNFTGGSASGHGEECEENNADQLFHIYNYFLNRPEAKYKSFDGQEYQIMIEVPLAGGDLPNQETVSDTAYVYMFDLDVITQQTFFGQDMAVHSTDDGVYRYDIESKYVKVFHDGDFPEHGDGYGPNGDGRYEFAVSDPQIVYADNPDGYDPVLADIELDTSQIPYLGKGRQKVKLVYARFSYDENYSVMAVHVARTIQPSVKFQWYCSGIDVSGTSTGDSNIQIHPRSGYNWDYWGAAEELITNPVEITRHLLLHELGYNDELDEDKYRMARIENSNINMAFSINEDINSKEVLEKIASQSMMTTRYRPSDGKIVIDTIKARYTDDDVDKIIAVDRIIKYSYKLTPIEKVAMQSRVVYKYNYLNNDYDGATETIQSPESYAIHYDILKQFNLYKYENYILETKANYIQDKASAGFLNKYKHEYNKNQHLIIDFKISLAEGLELEVGDILVFDKDLKSKPYGHSIVEERLLIDQKVYPYFMISSINKTPKDCLIQVYQLHELDLPELNQTADFEPGMNVFGCTNPDALNYDSLATIDDNSCIMPEGYFGCMDPAADNFNPDSVVDDGSCTYPSGTYPTYTGPIGAQEAATIEWIWSWEFRKYWMFNQSGNVPAYSGGEVQGQYNPLVYDWPYEDYGVFDPYDGDLTFNTRRNIWGYFPEVFMNIEGSQGIFGLGFPGGAFLDGFLSHSSYFTQHIPDDMQWAVEAVAIPQPGHSGAIWRRFLTADLVMMQIMYQEAEAPFVDVLSIPDYNIYSLTGDTLSLMTNMTSFITTMRDAIDLPNVYVPEGEPAPEIMQDVAGFPPWMIEALNVSGEGITAKSQNYIILLQLIAEDDEFYGEGDLG